MTTTQVYKIHQNREGSITMVTMADLLFDWFGFDQTGKTVANST